MGSALARGLVRSGVRPSDITISDPDRRKLEPLRRMGMKTAGDNRRAVLDSDLTFLAVKPDVVERVLARVRRELEGTLLVSLAAGVSTEFLERRSGARVVRVMPNLCAEVGEMASCYCLGRRATPEDEELVRSILSSIGITFRVDEDLMNAVTGLSGSGPAYIYLVLKAMRDAGRELGLPEEIALKLAAQTVKGAGKMLLEDGRSPEKLLDEVCTPGGTTVEGIAVLRRKKVEDAIKDAIKAAAKRAAELSR